MSFVLTVSNVAKSFSVYSREIHRVLSWFGFFLSKPKEYQALVDVSFNLAPGEAVGLIGLNGAGKSTLLKIITGTLKPSHGSVQVNGQVAAILELGMGFSPDLTGRQNVFHVAGLMGYGAADVQKVLDEIQDFSELGDYFEQPLRVYSSGMQMRLAFSIATAWRPDLLIVDEALSVGDSYFQHKSFDRIRKFSRAGTTLLLVSHDKQAIQSICTRAVLLDKGRVAMIDAPDRVMDFYNAMLAAHQKQHEIEHAHPETGGALLSGTGEAVFETVVLKDATDNKTELLHVGQAVVLEIAAHCLVDIDDLVLGFLIKDRYGQDVFGTNTGQIGKECADLLSGSRLVWRFSFDANIGSGTYSITVALHSKAGHVEHNYAWQERALVFEVINSHHPDFSGVAWLGEKLECSWHHESG